PSREPFHEGGKGPHFMAPKRQGATVQAALHTAIDSVFKCIDYTFSRAVLRELAPDADQGHGVGLGSRLQMAALARQIIAGEALVRIGHGWTDLIRRVDEERIAIFDEL